MDLDDKMRKICIDIQLVQQKVCSWEQWVSYKMMLVVVWSESEQ